MAKSQQFPQGTARILPNPGTSEIDEDGRDRGNSYGNTNNFGNPFGMDTPETYMAQLYNSLLALRAHPDDGTNADAYYGMEFDDLRYGDGIEGSVALWPTIFSPNLQIPNVPSNLQGPFNATADNPTVFRRGKYGGEHERRFDRIREQDTSHQMYPSNGVPQEHAESVKLKRDMAQVRCLKLNKLLLGDSA